MSPILRIAMPHAGDKGAARTKPTSKRPYTATFNMMPESSADALAGATGCASGSQKCKGTSPALDPKPMSAKPTITERNPIGSDAADGVALGDRWLGTHWLWVQGGTRSLALLAPARASGRAG